LNWQVTLLLKYSFSAEVEHRLPFPGFLAFWTMKEE